MPRGFRLSGGPHRRRGGGGERDQDRRPRRPILSLLRAFWPFIRPYRVTIVIGTGCVLIALLFEKVRPLLMRYLIDRGLTPVLQTGWSEAVYRNALVTCGIAIGGMLVLTATGALLSRVHMFIMHRAGAAMVKDLRVHIYRHLQRLSLNFFESRQTGEIMSRLTADVDAMEHLVTHVSDQVVNNVFNIIVTLGILFVLSWKLGLVALLPVPLLLILMTGFARRIRPTYRAVRDYFGGVTARLQDNIAGIRVIKAF
ncbi:MAG: hypothetical protein K9N51_10690, partial [Candidatus Pacebacteria bacterium]|nr:hypothetical protein [Candidatus Paceibacterota bacterium]